jgi:AcrR family transcriptional regulator
VTETCLAGRTRYGPASEWGMTVRKNPRYKHSGAERIRLAAVELFRDRGYHGTSVRDLAQVVSMETASLYYHYPSKQDILLALMDRTMDDLIDGIGRSITDKGGAEARLKSAVRFHVDFHLSRQAEAFVSHSELRSLTEENRRRIIAKRDRYEEFLRTVLMAGIEENCFEIEDVALTSTAILMMCSGVSDWFGRRGRLSRVSVADQYVNLIVRMIARPRQRRTTSKTGREPAAATAPETLANGFRPGA